MRVVDGLSELLSPSAARQQVCRHNPFPSTDPCRGRAHCQEDGQGIDTFRRGGCKDKECTREENQKRRSSHCMELKFNII